MCRASRGLSLLEVLLAAGLALTLLTVIANVLVPLGRLTTRSTAQVELRQLAATSLERLGADLSRSAAEGIAVSAGPQEVVIAIQPLVDLTSDGRQVWAEQLVVYRWRRSDGRLCRREWPPAPPDLGWLPALSRPQRPNPVELARLAQEGDYPSVLSSWVKSLTVTGGQPPLFRLPLTVALELERAGLGPGGLDKHQASASFYLRNSSQAP